MTRYTEDLSKVYYTEPPKLIHVSRIKSAEFQPERRAKEVADLVRSIESGLPLISPITVVKVDHPPGRYSVVDGHRRLAAATICGAKHVPCMVIDDDQAHAFSVLNGTSKHMTGKDNQEIYSKDPNALTAAARKNQEKAKAYLGEDFYVELVSEGKVSITSLVNECRRAERFLRDYEGGFTANRTSADVVRAVLVVGQFKLVSVLRERGETDRAKASRIRKLLFGRKRK